MSKYLDHYGKLAMDHALILEGRLHWRYILINLFGKERPWINR